MKTLAYFFAALAFVGCHEPFNNDDTPPGPPQGIQATAGDNTTLLTWLESQDRDVEGYKIWVSSSYNGAYDFVGKTSDLSYLDRGAKNGVREYYALSAYDFDGNESDLSKDVVYAIPRPEGYGTKVADFRSSPTTGGFDFSTYSIGMYNDDMTDLYYESVNGRYYIDVWQDTDIQDMGYTTTLDEIALAPPAGYSPSKSVEAIPGHTYVIWTWDNHYAKVRVREVTPTRVTFDWAYQLTQAAPELKQARATNAVRTFHPSGVTVAAK